MFIPIGIDRPLVRVPYATMTMMLLNVIVQLVISLGHFSFDPEVAFGFVPGRANASILTLFTHMFVHGGWGHLIGNLIFFAAAGIKLEDALGAWRFLLFYLGCGIMANMVYVLISSRDVPLPLVGASGAIAGVMGGFVLLYPYSKVHVILLLGRWWPHFFMPTLLFFGLWIGKELFFFVLDLQSASTEGGVAFGAHVGGFFAGVFWAWAFVGWNKGDTLDDDRMTGYKAPQPGRA